MRSSESVDPLLSYLLKKNIHVILCPFFLKPHLKFTGKIGSQRDGLQLCTTPQAENSK